MKGPCRAGAVEIEWLLLKGGAVKGLLAVEIPDVCDDGIAWERVGNGPRFEE